LARSAPGRCASPLPRGDLRPQAPNRSRLAPRRASDTRPMLRAVFGAKRCKLMRLE